MCGNKLRDEIAPYMDEIIKRRVGPSSETREQSGMAMPNGAVTSNDRSSTAKSKEVITGLR